MHSDRIGFRGHGACCHTHGTRGLPELSLQVLPLANSQVMEVFGAAHLAELVGRERFLTLTEVAPEIEVCEEVRGGIGEPGMHLIGGLFRWSTGAARPAPSTRLGRGIPRGSLGCRPGCRLR